MADEPADPAEQAPAPPPTRGKSIVNLPSLGLSVRVAFTGYLIVISVGLMMAGGQIFMTHGMADGEIGLSVKDVVYSYYGNRGNSRLEAKLNGTMKDKADTHDRAQIIEWVRNGSPESEYNSTIQPIFAANCIKCHGAIPGLTPFTTYAEIQPVAQIDMGASISSLTRVSHIHLFGIAFIFFFVVLIFALCVGLPAWLKTICIATPFLFLLVDIGAWWLTKWYAWAAYLTITAGAAYNAAAAFMILTSLYQMWIMPRRAPAYGEQPVFES